MRHKTLSVVALAIALLVPAFAAAHAERPTEAPARPGAVPDPSRTPTAVLDVCKTPVDGTPGCPYQHIQAAVNAAPDGALIRIWPGRYNEEPSRLAPSLPPDVAFPHPALALDEHYAYEHHVLHPNSQNLIAVVGKKDVTLRGMGDDPDDVVIDVEFKKHVGIRGDRADGLVIQNLAVYHAFDHNVYVLDQDGFWIEGVHSYYGYEYDFLMFAVDHGVLKDCLAVGAGDAGVYPGGTADIPAGRADPWSVEVTGCESHHNVLGYSGTQGNYVNVHDNAFWGNGVGLVSDSETDHPNYPQKGSRFAGNVIRDNNFNFYATCDATYGCIEPTVLVGSILLPVGTGLFLASNNANTVVDNTIYGHIRTGAWLASGQGLVIGPTSLPPAPPFASADNRFLSNDLFGPAGQTNAIDFSWDGMGLGNCWTGNDGSPAPGVQPPTSDGVDLPPCPDAGDTIPPTANRPNAADLVAQAGLVYVEGPDGNRPLCFYLELEPCVGGSADPAGGFHAAARNEPAGYLAPPTPDACGPSSASSCWT